MTMTSNNDISGKGVRKQYVKPTLEVIELRPDERIAGPSGKDNCAACQGANACAPGGLHGEGV